MKDPASVPEWLDVARERGSDAASMLPQRATSVGPAYMAGYAVEAALKAYLQARHIPRPTSGPAGHDIRALVKAAQLRLPDILRDNEHAAFFVDDWSPALRYQAQPAPDQPEAPHLVAAAQRLVGLVTGRIKRHRRNA